MSFSSTDPNCTVCHAKAFAVACCPRAQSRWCLDCAPMDNPGCPCPKAAYTRVRAPRVGELTLLAARPDGTEISTPLATDSVKYLLEALRASSVPQANALAKAITSMLG